MNISIAGGSLRSMHIQLRGKQTMENYAFRNEPINSEECYVAFLDIQGFKDYVTNHSLSETCSLFYGIVNEIGELRETATTSWQSDDERERTRILCKKTYITLISDSIVIAIEKQYPCSLEFLVSSCIRIQLNLLIYHSVLVRGGISIGSLHANAPILFGTGIVRSYNLEQSTENYFFRIIVDDCIIADTPKTYQTLKLLRDENHDKPEKEIWMLDYLSCIPWRNSHISDKISLLIKSQLKMAYEKNDSKLIEKYEWLEKQVAYSALEYEKVMEEHERERSYRRKSFL